MLNLTKKQKEFLFEKEYVTAKTLDALTTKGWQQYFINNFDWKLETQKNNYRMNDLYLFSRKSDFSYHILLNFQGSKLKELISLGEKKLYIITHCNSEGNCQPECFTSEEKAIERMKVLYNECLKNLEYVFCSELYKTNAQVTYTDDTFDEFQIYEIEVDE